MPKPDLQLVVSNAEPLMDIKENPQCMFLRFARTSTLDVDGMNGAKEFLKLFFGGNPLRLMCLLLLHFTTLTIRTRFLSREDLEFLIVIYGHYSHEEAEKFVGRALDKEIRYAETEKKMKYFMLRKKKGVNEYRLVLYTRQNLYSD